MVRGGWDFKVSINQDYRRDFREYFSESKDFRFYNKTMMFLAH